MNCPFCNQSIPDGSSFCGFCGNKITGAEQSAESEASESIEQDSESAVTAVEEPEEVTASGAPEDAAPAEPDVIQSVSRVNLGKGGAEAAHEENGAEGNDIADQVREGIQDAAASVRSDTQEAVAAVKNGNFKELLKNKTFLIACAAVIAVIILIIIIAACSAGAGSAHKLKGAYYRVEDSGDSVFFYNGAVVKGADFSDSASILAASVDGSAAVVEDDEDLYILKGAKASLITDDFDSSSANISANGKTVAYVSEESVFVYTGGKPKKIADLEEDGFCYPVISPNGKVVAFSDVDDDDIKAYVWKGGNKSIDLDSGVVPFAVSDGGKMIFGANDSGKLCYIKNLKKGSEEKIDEVSGVVGISFDHTKLIYINDGDTYCFDTSLNKQDGVRVCRGSVAPLSDFAYQNSVVYIENFKKFYGEEDGNLYKYFRKGKEYNDEKLVSDVGSLLVSEDYKSLVYTEDGDVMKGTLSNAKNAKKVGKDAVSIRANDSLSAVYYCDDDKNLRYTVKDKKVASDLKRYVVTEGGVCVFSDVDGDLYYSAKGGEKKKTELDEVSSLVIRNKVVYVISDGEVFTSTNGKSFKKTGVSAD